jgi:hypothetical protein
MIRSKTTLIVGAGASCELGIVSSDELLLKIGQSFDFSRLGSETQTRDGLLLSQYLGKLAARIGRSEEDVHRAAERLRIASRMGRSIDTVLDQHDTHPLIAACGKLAVVHFLAQSEAKSILRLTPRMAGDLPIQGTETWLYQLGQLVTSGVPRSQVEKCFDELAIVAFTYDRSIEHFLPHAMVMAFGMSLQEAQAIVAARLRIIHPYGTIGRLPWQPGDGAELEWGAENPWNIHNLAAGLRTSGEIMRDAQALMQMRAMVAGAKRIAFLGFGYQPQNMDMLIDFALSHDPEVIATVWGLSKTSLASVMRVFRRKIGIEDETLLLAANARANDVMRDYALLLES